jgi:hypothetical protein
VFVIVGVDVSLGTGVRDGRCVALGSGVALGRAVALATSVTVIIGVRDGAWTMGVPCSGVDEGRIVGVARGTPSLLQAAKTTNNIKLKREKRRTSIISLYQVRSITPYYDTNRRLCRTLV